MPSMNFTPHVTCPCPFGIVTLLQVCYVLSNFTLHVGCASMWLCMYVYLGKSFCPRFAVFYPTSLYMLPVHVFWGKVMLPHACHVSRNSACQSTLYSVLEGWRASGFLNPCSVKGETSRYVFLLKRRERVRRIPPVRLMVSRGNG